MKTALWAAAAVSFGVPTGLMAEGAAAPKLSTQGPPPAVISQINLGNAGLMMSFASGAQKGATSGRGGRDGTRIGTATASGQSDGYKHNTTTFIPSLTGTKMIQSGKAYLTFGLQFNKSDEDPNKTEFETQIPGFSVGYENFANPNAAWSVSLTRENRTTDSGKSPVKSSDQSTELRFAYARKLSDNWGFTNQTYITKGENVVETPGGTTKTPELTLYTQFEAVGAFGSDQLGFVPEGWGLHPTLGISYQTKEGDAPGGKVTEKDGSVWAKAVLAKQAKPGTFAPNMTLGIEHIYQTDTADKFIEDDKYAILGVGGVFIGDGASVNVAFERRVGFNKIRRTSVLVKGISFDF